MEDVVEFDAKKEIRAEKFFDMKCVSPPCGQLEWWRSCGNGLSCTTGATGRALCPCASHGVVCAPRCVSRDLLKHSDDDEALTTTPVASGPIVLAHQWQPVANIPVVTRSDKSRRPTVKESSELATQVRAAC